MIKFQNFKIISRYKGFFLILLGFSILGFAKALNDTNKYSVQSKFIIKPITQSEDLKGFNLLELNENYNQKFLESKYFSALIYSTDFLLNVIKSTEIVENIYLVENNNIIINDEMQENLNYLKKSIAVDIDKKTDLITLTVTTESSKKSLELISEVKRSFIRILQETYRNGNLATINFLDKEITRKRFEIEELENDFSTYNDSNLNLIKTSLILKQQALKQKIESELNFLETLILQKNKLIISNSSGGYTVLDVENSYATTFKTSIRKLFIIFIYLGIGTFLGLFYEIYKFIIVRDSKYLAR